MTPAAALSRPPSPRTAPARSSYTWWFPIIGSLRTKTALIGRTPRPKGGAGKDGWDGDWGVHGVLDAGAVHRSDVLVDARCRTRRSRRRSSTSSSRDGVRFGPAGFNESLATFVGRTAALQLIEERHGRGSTEAAEAVARFADEALFDEFISDLYSRLSELYESGHTREEKLALRAGIFDGAREELKSLSPRFRTGSFRRLREMELNNAVVVAQYRYGRYNEFRRVFERVRNSWPAFFAAVSAAASSANPLETVEALAREP